MKILTIIIFLLTFCFSFSQERSLNNQGEQENFRAEELFKNEYQKQYYPKFNGEIKIISKTEIQFGNKTLFVFCSEDQMPIFTKGIFYPQLIFGFSENNEILSNEEYAKLSDGEKFLYNLNRNDSFQISSFGELPFLSDSPKIKRFRFWNFKEGFANPQVYYFELTNENATEETSIDEFIQDAELTFLKFANILI